jgi:hypothetical protein
MWSRRTHERGQALGLDPWAFYFGGRAGVLGDVDADVVRATFVFFPEEMVDRSWAAARAVMPPTEIVREYAACGHGWARARLAGVEGIERLAALLEAVTDAADPAGAPLFAGWRALPRPDDALGRAAQLLTALRELRGAVHAAAVLAAGLTPLQAVLSGPGGEANAEFFGWPKPWPDVSAYRPVWQAADETTDRLAARVFDPLSEQERSELAELLGRAQAAVAR